MKHPPLDVWLELLENRHPVKIDLGLERVATVAARLGLLAPAPLVITVAGTNGKGSCVAVLEYLLRRCGYRVGSFTSPHLLAFNERIRIQGQPVSDAPICRAFGDIEAARGATGLTYFEFNTLAALQIMRDEYVDVAVLEVGLGGRLDAVNIVDADVAVITSIDLDHTEWLGTGRSQIALEKAGIARPGRPLICADPEPPEALVRHLAARQVAPLFIGPDFASTQIGDGGPLSLRCRQADGSEIIYAPLALPRVPVGSAVAAVQALQAAGIVPEHLAVQAAFAEVQLPGRYQTKIFRDRRVILDVAHNPAASSYLAAKLAKEKCRQVLLVAAIMKDKDIAGFIEPLQQIAERWFLASLSSSARACSADQLASMVYNAGGRASTHDSVEAALAAAAASAGADDLIVVCGSFITVGAALALISADPVVNE